MTFVESSKFRSNDSKLPFWQGVASWFIFNYSQLKSNKGWINAVTALFLGASTVRIRHLAVPDAVRAGTEVRLTCDYDLEVNRMAFLVISDLSLQGQTLQTVKWYKGSHEFYRYYPRNYPEPKKFFVLPKLFLSVGYRRSICWGNVFQFF